MATILFGYGRRRETFCVLPKPTFLLALLALKGQRDRRVPRGRKDPQEPT